MIRCLYIYTHEWYNCSTNFSWFYSVFVVLDDIDLVVAADRRALCIVRTAFLSARKDASTWRMARSTSCSISGSSRHSAMSSPLDGESSMVSPEDSALSEGVI